TDYADLTDSIRVIRVIRGLSYKRGFTSFSKAEFSGGVGGGAAGDVRVQGGSGCQCDNSGVCLSDNGAAGGGVVGFWGIRRRVVCSDGLLQLLLPPACRNIGDCGPRKLGCPFRISAQLSHCQQLC